MRALITGGAGFIGSYTVSELVRHKAKKVIIFDNFSRGKIRNIEQTLKYPSVEIFSLGGDILRTDILNKAFEEGIKL